MLLIVLIYLDASFQGFFGYKIFRAFITSGWVFRFLVGVFSVFDCSFVSFPIVCPNRSFTCSI